MIDVLSLYMGRCADRSERITVNRHHDVPQTEIVVLEDRNLQAHGQGDKQGGAYRQECDALGSCVQTIHLPFI